MKFLIDECLSPHLVVVARNRGFHESTHVTWLGMRSRKDWTIVRRAIQEGFILVTNNSVDFATLLRHEEIHPGLVCLNTAPGLMNLTRQIALFNVALDRVALDRLAADEPINEVIEVTLIAENKVTVERYSLPGG